MSIQVHASCIPAERRNLLRIMCSRHDYQIYMYFFNGMLMSIQVHASRIPAERRNLLRILCSRHDYQSSHGLYWRV